MDIYVITTENQKIRRLRISQEEVLQQGKDEEAIAVQLKELFTSVTESIKTSLDVESQLMIEVSGSLDLKVEGGTKYLFLNLGGHAAANGTMKVVLTTTIKPHMEIAQTKELKSE